MSGGCVGDPRDWPQLLSAAADIVRSYETPVTLRQLFYRLVATTSLPNSLNAYKSLSKHTAAARRAGTFPVLMDRTRVIHRDVCFAGPDDARHFLRRLYRRDRTEGQAWAVYLGVEKAGIVEQLREWFGDLGIPVLALGGYTSQSFIDVVAEAVRSDGRPAVLLYAGDFDPSGEDIDRDFIARTGCWSEVRRVALTASQVEAFALPPLPGKKHDSRAAAFTARHGSLMQVELDALPPPDLRELFDAAIAPFWDSKAWAASVSVERLDVLALERTA